MRSQERIVIPLDICIALNESITKAKIIKETMSQRIQKLNSDYRRTVNNYYVDYIDYRKLIEKKFEMDLSPKSNSMILYSNVFKENEVQFFEMIKFFKNNPSKLAELLNGDISADRVQKIIDFVFQGMFPCFLNSTCWCKQNIKIFSFMRTAIFQEFQNIPQSKTFVDMSIMSDKILKSLLKKSETFRFFKYFLLKSTKILMDDANPNDPQFKSSHMKFNHFHEKLKLDRKVDNFYGKSKNYKHILENFFIARKISFNKFTLDIFNEVYANTNEHNVSADFILRRTSSSYKMSVKSEGIFADIESINKNTKTFIDCLIKMIQKYFPVELKYFFYLMKIVNDSISNNYNKIISMYFIRGILINSCENLEDYFTFEEDKIIDRNNIRSVVDLIIQKCHSLLNKEYGEGPLQAFIDALVEIPDLLKQIDSDEIQEFKTNISNQIKDASYVEFMKNQLLGHFDNKLPTHDFIPDEKTENLHNRRYSNLAKFKKTKSVIISNDSGVIKKELKELNKDFYKYCNFHTETTCIALFELSELVDLYNQTRDSNDSSMSLELYKNLVSILKNTEKDNLQNVNDMNIYIVFYENINNPENNKKITKALNQGNIVNILSNDFVSREILERFADKSFRDLVNYGLHNWMFDDDSQFESKNEFLTYKFDMNLKNIFIGKKQKKDTNESSLKLTREKSYHEKLKQVSTETLNTSDPPNSFQNMFSESTENGKKETEDQTTKTIEKLKNFIFYYDAFDGDITTKNYQLGAKKHEIFAATNECHKFREFRKSIIEIKLSRDFEKMLENFALDICVVSDSKISSTSPNPEFSCQRSINCPLQPIAQNWSTIWNAKTMAPINKDSFTDKIHIHFDKIFEIIQFLEYFRVPCLFVEQNRYNNFLQGLMQGVIKVYEHNIEKNIEKHLLNEYKKVAAKDENIFFLFNNFISSKLNSLLFPQNLSLLDDGFKINCEVLSFLRLHDFGKIKNWEKIESNLSAPIKKINKISSILSYDSIMKTLQIVMQKITGTISAINHSDAGADDLIPTFIYCIIQAKPSNYISMFKFIDLFTNSSESKGRLGFIVKQIEISIKIIEDWSTKNLTSAENAGQILKMEVDKGIHFLRVRNKKKICERIFESGLKMLI